MKKAKIFRGEMSLYVLITSYFICIPLGRFSAFGFLSDFRIYDVMGIVFIILNYNLLKSTFSLINSDRRWPAYFALLLCLSVSLGVVVSVAYSGPKSLPIYLIRLFRFWLYFSSFFFAFAIIKNFAIWRRAVKVFYINVVVQAILAFMQGVNVIGSFWPNYWLNSYGGRNFAVGTLSPHHKHIAVIMLIGLALSLAFISLSRSVLKKLLFSAILCIMIFVPLFEGTKTFVFSALGMFLAYLYMQNIFKSIGSLLIYSLLLLLAYGFLPDNSQENINLMTENRMFRWVEQGNVSKLMTSRDKIYEASFLAILDKPYLLITGTGFQNIDGFIYATGAHNNYLHFLMETGLVGFILFIMFLKIIWKSLKLSYNYAKSPVVKEVSKYAWIGFIGVLFSLFTGEVLYAQYSMFTLAGQVLMFFGIVNAPMFWISKFGNTANF